MKDHHRWARTVGRLSRQPGARRTEAAEPAAGEAQRRTAEVLKRLPGEKWTVVDRSTDRRDAPAHVVIGPGGVYLIASQQPGGCVRVREGVAWLRRGADSQADRPAVGMGRCAVDPARALHRELRARGGECGSVHAVVVLWSEFPQSVAETSQVAYVHGRSLLGWLQAREPELDASAREPLALAAAEALREAPRRAPRIARRHSA